MRISRAARLIIVGFSLTMLILTSALPASAGGPASKWRVGYYTPSNPGTLSMSSTPQGGGIAAFDFTSQSNTALLVTNHGAYKGQLLGDLTGRTITTTFGISGAGAFTYWGQGTADNPCATPANVRLFFTTDNGGGFAYTHYWWSNPESRVLANGQWTLTATVEPAEWSDWNGQTGTTEAAGFADAASNVTSIGFSFGGGCFFENGVGTSNGSGTFQLNTFNVAA